MRDIFMIFVKHILHPSQMPHIEDCIVLNSFGGIRVNFFSDLDNGLLRSEINKRNELDCNCN